MKTKIYLLLIALVTTVSSVWAADSGTVSGNLTWVFNSGTLTISNSTPATPEAMPVNWVAHTATSGARPSWESHHHADITKVVITAGVETIGTNAFAGYENLEEVDLENATDLTSIDDNAFLECANLTTVKMSESITKFGRRIFRLSGITEVTIPRNLETIANDVFFPCYDLERFVVQAGNSHFKLDDEGKALLTIDGSTFVAYPAALTDSEYTLPATVVSFMDYINIGGTGGAGAGVPVPVNHFIGCGNLTTIKVAAGSSAYKSVGGVLFSLDGKTLVAYPAGKSGDHYEIPYGVEVVFGRAFAYNEIVKTVDIPSSVTEMDFQAFNSSSLVEITIPETVTFLGHHVFSHSKIETLTIDGDPYISNSCFEGCLSLRSVEFKKLTRTGEYMFIGCTSLTDVNLGESLTTIGRATFMNCTNLEELVIPNSVESFDRQVFSGCTSLTDLIITSDSFELPTDVNNLFPPGVTIYLPNGYDASKAANLETLLGVTVSPDRFYLVLYKSEGVNYLTETYVVSAGNYTLIQPTAPTRSGYVFDGWYDSISGTPIPFDNTEYNDNMTIMAMWSIAPVVTPPTPPTPDPVKAMYTVTINPLSGVNVVIRSSSNTVEEGGRFSFDASATNSGYILTVFVDGSSISSTNGENRYLIEDIRENKTVTFRLVAGSITPTPPGDDPVIPGPGTPGGPGQVIIDGNTPSDLGKLPGDGQIIVRPPLVDPNSPTPPKVTIDGKEVDGHWTTDKDGNPVFVIDLDGLEDGDHTIVINDKEFDFTVDSSPVIPGPGTPGGPGQIIIDENSPSELPGEFPGDGQIIIRPPLVDPNDPTPPKVIIDGKEVEGEWKTDEDGNPVFVIDLDGLEDGKHTIIINDKEFEFTVDKNARPTSNDVLSTATVAAGYGSVTIDTPKSATVYIVSFSGSVVYNAKVIGTATVNVPAGIYVVVVDGSVTKVVVR